MITPPDSASIVSNKGKFSTCCHTFVSPHNSFNLAETLFFWYFWSILHNFA
jgi:hypothetical protein